MTVPFNEPRDRDELIARILAVKDHITREPMSDDELRPVLDDTNSFLLGIMADFGEAKAEGSNDE